MAGGIGPRRGNLAEINVTPLVDVMLVLLIIFMVITPMLSKGVSVDMVRARNPIAMKEADREDAVLVAVTRDGQTFLGRLSHTYSPPYTSPPKRHLSSANGGTNPHRIPNLNKPAPRTPDSPPSVWRGSFSPPAFADDHKRFSGPAVRGPRRQLPVGFS